MVKVHVCVCVLTFVLLYLSYFRYQKRDGFRKIKVPSLVRPDYRIKLLGVSRYYRIVLWMRYVMPSLFHSPA